MRFYKQPPEQSILVQTGWVNLRLTLADWAESFGSVENGTPWVRKALRPGSPTGNRA